MNILRALVLYALPKYSFEKVIGISGKKKKRSIKAHVAFLNIRAG